ncbi:cytochrome c [Methylomarinum sp. Ch1-1]|uniref:Cytochrome c n=1 Tax=Methylomarinum roseum TaxID=3067653 RepID=A0AAU7NS35_9GAMM|nr:cytochrome c [Methylomarinum sp. Ch1-1]MDP4520565.1 cytochrome c [Methylomarinum sp. Ch1-1]
MNKDNLFPTLIMNLAMILFCGELSAAPWPEIQLQRDLTPSSLTSTTVEVPKDPVYQTAKHYRAYPLKGIIDELSADYAGDLQQAVLVFTAIDGYKVSMAYPDALEEQGYLAFRDLDANENDWIAFKFGKEKITPAPYYLVWSKADIDKWRYPWPFQLSRITLQPARIYFGKAAPVSTNDKISRGFAEFSRYCIRCHAVNGSGGSVGPELNAPQNVSERYADKQLTGLILNNPAYRPNSKMPVFAELLNDAQVNSILAYLKAMKSHKQAVNETD